MQTNPIAKNGWTVQAYTIIKTWNDPIILTEPSRSNSLGFGSKDNIDVTLLRNKYDILQGTVWQPNGWAVGQKYSFQILWELGSETLSVSIFNYEEYMKV